MRADFFPPAPSDSVVDDLGHNEFVHWTLGLCWLPFPGDKRAGASSPIAAGGSPNPSAEEAALSSARHRIGEREKPLRGHAVCNFAQGL